MATAGNKIITLLKEIKIKNQHFIIRAFKAVEEKETCRRFLEGHVKVLADYGITNITTNNASWMDNPAIYVVIAQSLDGKEIYGGVRVHIADGVVPLPLESAIGKMEPRVHELIKGYLDEGTGELCALWNAKEVAGLGISLLLIRAGISIVTQIALNSLFTICADYTMPMVRKVGFIMEDSIGNKGGFVYPNENYIARVLRKMNAISLDTADEYDKNRILDLRNYPIQNFAEEGPKGKVLINYQLLIKRS